jgi:hypothetical protein
LAGALSDDEIRALAEAFHSALGATQLLEAAGLNRARQLTWGDRHTPLEFWQEVSNQIGAGVLPNGRVRLLTAAARVRPGNRVFAVHADLSDLTGSGRSRSWLRRLVAMRPVATAAVIAAAAAISTAAVLTSERGGEPDGTAVQPSGAPAATSTLYHECAAGTRSIWNHQSALFINADDRPFMGTERSATRISLSPDAPVTPTDCPVQLHPASNANSDLCMDLGPDLTATERTSTNVVWRECGGDAGQRWIIRFHWKSDYSNRSGSLVYYHIRPAGDETRCLQQAQDGGPGTALTVKTCDAGWLQQWVLESVR